MRLKILWVFIGGILAPTGLLIYLGLASIRTESRLVQKEAAERLGASAETMRAQMETALKRLAEPLELLARSSGLDARTQWTAADRLAFVRLKDRFSPPLNHLWVCDASERFVHPFRETPTAPPIRAPLPNDLRARAAEAESVEFSEPAKGEALYRALAQEAPSSAWRAHFLMRAAGCAMKEKRYPAAESLYTTVSKEVPMAVDEQGLPYGLLASIQRAEAMAKRHDASGARTLRLELLQMLSAGEWAIPWSDERFFTERMLASLGNTQAIPSGAALRNREYEQATRFRDRDWPKIQSAIKAANRTMRPTLWMEPSSRDALLVVPVVGATGATRRWTILAWIPAERAEARLREPLEALAASAGLAIQTERASDQPLLHVRIPLEGVLPARTWVISPLERGEAERLAIQRRRIAVGIVLLAALVIGVALYTTWAALSKEMEVAQLKARFVAGISHELKTPLSIIDLIGQKLTLGRYSSPEEIRDYYAMLTDETARLKGLIEDVLDFSRLMENRSPYRIEPLDWIPLIQETLERFKASVPRQDFSIPFETPLTRCPVRGDREALSRVLLNLLDNAVKYSPADRLDLRVRLAREGPHAVLAVSDRGHGIAPSEQSMVFERFFRGQSATAQGSTPGAGLGLSIVSHIITAHAGSIRVESRPGEGSTFFVTLPIEEAGA